MKRGWQRCRSITVSMAAVMLSVVGTCAAYAQAAAQPKGHEILTAKCFQCHTDSMWRDQRQSARAWEATLYRMIGRGALWEPDEVKQMAEYLGTDFGPGAPKAAAPK